MEASRFLGFGVAIQPCTVDLCLPSRPLALKIYPNVGFFWSLEDGLFLLQELKGSHSANMPDPLLFARNAVYPGKHGENKTSGC